jgi:hypothetical protein
MIGAIIAGATILLSTIPISRISKISISNLLR